MSDIAKWALLVAGAVLALAMIFAVAGDPFSYVDTLGDVVELFVFIVEPYLRFGRGLINNFVFDPVIVTIVLSYILLKWFMKLALKILAWVYHYIFK